MGHVHSQVSPADNPLNFDVVEVFRQWVGWYLPTLHPETVSQVVEGPVNAIVNLVLVADNWQFGTVIDDFKVA